MLTQGRVVVNGDVVHGRNIRFNGDNLEVLQRQQAEERSPPPLDKPNVDLDVLYKMNPSRGQQTPPTVVGGNRPTNRTRFTVDG